jgi:hypothetical protein
MTHETALIRVLMLHTKLFSAFAWLYFREPILTDFPLGTVI